MTEKEKNNSIQNNTINKISDTNEKTYLNLYFCTLSTGIIAAYVYIIFSIIINIVNRVLFLQYEFDFNYTLLFLQQLICTIFYIIASRKSTLFKESAGEISFKDFYKLKFIYIGYSIFYIVKNIISFLGYQIVKNIPMYVNLRKLVTAMTFIYQFFFKKKKISTINILVVILLTVGAILSGIDDYTTDFLGYLIVFTKNTMSVMNLEISENFKNKYGISNIKLLAYNSFILPIFLIIFIFIFGEYKDVISYFKSEHNFSYFGLFFNLFISCFIVFVNNISFFISNEKIKSLLTQLLSDSKYIFITLISYIVLKTFTFSWKNILGLAISTSGSIIITISSMCDNIKFKKKNINELTEEKIIELSGFNNKSSDDKNRSINSNSDIKEEKLSSLNIINNNKNNESINNKNENISNVKEEKEDDNISNNDKITNPNTISSNSDNDISFNEDSHNNISISSNCNNSSTSSN